MVKAKDAYACAPAMTAPSLKEDLRLALCCAACLHAITAPERPVHFDGCFFHVRHLPAEAMA